MFCCTFDVANVIFRKSYFLSEKCCVIGRKFREREDPLRGRGNVKYTGKEKFRTFIEIF